MMLICVATVAILWTAPRSRAEDSKLVTEGFHLLDEENYEEALKVPYRPNPDIQPDLVSHGLAVWEEPPRLAAAYLREALSLDKPGHTLSGIVIYLAAALNQAHDLKSGTLSVQVTLYWDVYAQWHDAEEAFLESVEYGGGVSASFPITSRNSPRKTTRLVDQSAAIQHAFRSLSKR